MKRALAILAVASMFGFAGFAQFSGEWDTNIHVLQTPSLDYTKLTINYEWSGWTFTSLSKFTNAGYSEQSFSGEGELGPVSIDGTMAFSPADTAYSYTDVSASSEFAGISFDLGIFHGVYPYAKDYFEDAYYPLEWTDVCQTPQTGSVLILYTVSAKADPVSAQVRFKDCCTGTAFYDASISLSGISLCCGITSDATVTFTKEEGFKSLEFALKDVFPICCGISFDINVTFTTDGKTISIKPKMADIGEACFALYADLESEGGENADLYLNGLRVDGWKIRCDLAECNYIEIVSFLSPDKAPNYGYKGVFEGDEFEYAKLGFCGPGCCGGNYSVDIAVYFGGGTLFDISRVGADMTIPVMSNFDVKVKFATPNSLDVGWTFTF